MQSFSPYEVRHVVMGLYRVSKCQFKAICLTLLLASKGTHKTPKYEERRLSFIFRFLRVYSARVKINGCYGKLNVDLTCSFCCDLQWGGVWGGAPQYKTTKNKSK